MQRIDSVHDQRLCEGGQQIGEPLQLEGAVINPSPGPVQFELLQRRLQTAQGLLYFEQGISPNKMIEALPSVVASTCTEPLCADMSAYPTAVDKQPFS